MCVCVCVCVCVEHIYIYTVRVAIDTGKEKGLATEVAVNFIRVSPYVLKNGVHSKKLTYAGCAYTRRTKNTRSLRT